MKVSKNFSLKELTKTECRIDNIPDSRALMNIAVLAAKILQPCRDEFGPIRVTSCFRSVDVNKAIGGSETSDHCAAGTAAAADFEVISEPIAPMSDKVKPLLEAAAEAYKADKPEWQGQTCS